VVPIPSDSACAALLIALRLSTVRHHDQKQAGPEAQAQGEKDGDEETR
jgi:hypothetical protein